MSSYAVVYPALADRLALKVPTLGWVDLDQGQLAAPDTEYPLPLDRGVVLLDFDETAWHDLGLGYQRGQCSIRVTLAVEVAADVYQASAQRGAALAKLALLDAVHKALNHFDGGGAFGALVRTYSRKEVSERAGVWVYSMGYDCLLKDEAGYDGYGQTITGLDTTGRPGFVLPSRPPGD